MVKKIGRSNIRGPQGSLPRTLHRLFPGLESVIKSHSQHISYMASRLWISQRLCHLRNSAERKLVLALPFSSFDKECAKCSYALDLRDVHRCIQ